MQLAAEAYRVQLDGSATLDRCDWNHNVHAETDDVKTELRRELDKTDDLLRRLQQRLSHAKSIRQSYDTSALRGVLTDMTTLLQLQQRLYRQINELRPIASPPAEPSSCFPRPPAQDENSPGGNEDEGRWISMERRLTASIRQTVRAELRRMRPRRLKKLK